MKKTLIVIAGVIILGIIIFLAISMTSKKMVCKSDNGNITIMYNNKGITAYTALNISFDFSAQSKIADQIGVENYLNEFSTWFSENTNGTCAR